MAWETTKTQHLLKNSESGVYYARIKQGGKQVWQSLKTDVYSVAKAKLPGKISELRNAPGAKPGVEKGKISLENLIGSRRPGIDLPQPGREDQEAQTECNAS
jgi:hypothetical protein